jgi:hypothetical protein
MERSKEMQKFTDNFAKKAFGKSQTECSEQKICVYCHKKVENEDFRDDISRKEYGISGLCQKCQDDTFGV